MNPTIKNADGSSWDKQTKQAAMNRRDLWSYIIHEKHTVVQRPLRLHGALVAEAPPTRWRSGRALSWERKAALIAGQREKPAMASLRQEHHYGLSCGKSNKNSPNRTLYHVKLTDTSIRALEAYQNLKVPFSTYVSACVCACVEMSNLLPLLLLF